MYQVLCKRTGHLYVGSSADIDLRWEGHKQALRRGKHPNKALQYAWTTFGEPEFEFSTLELCEEHLLEGKESKWLKNLGDSAQFNLSTSTKRKARTKKTSATTVRLTEGLHKNLKWASLMKGVSQTQIIEDALEEYLDNHDLLRHYQLTVTPTNVVLIEAGGASPKILEVSVRNGLTPEQLRVKYSTKLMRPVNLVVQEEDEYEQH